ncbi:hypothetical protein EV686_10745 [Paracandidimonas soli]|uniref:Uncharacterized protein n=1 Tax=Paracandidimonas soli TaxID=1917182 RepID=A0A4R3UYU0_9BURK|nr:hypothetical protein EV686_10745 [Paracandidimonas soli]
MSTITILQTVSIMSTLAVPSQQHQDAHPG